MATATLKSLDQSETLLNQFEITVQEKEGEMLHESSNVKRLYGHFKYTQKPDLQQGKYMMELDGKTYQVVIYRTEFHEKVAYYETIPSSL